LTAETTKESIFLGADRTASGKRRFWIYIIFFFLAWTARATVLYRIDSMIASEFWRHSYSNAVKFLIWVLPAFAFLRFTGEPKPLEYLKMSTPLDRRGLKLAATVTALYFLGVVLVESALRRVSPAKLLAAPAPMLLSTIIGVAVSPLLEEIMFRGFVLGKLTEWSRFWRANLIASLLFSFAHWPYWIWSRMPLVAFGRNVVNVSWGCCSDGW
jgi:membrane protease YdiL (CAAX protease family)